MTTLKKPYFYRVLGPFPFSFFSFFCFYFSNIKKEKTKNAIFFSKTSFLTSPKFCKNTILTHCCTICVSKNAPKHYKNGENSEKNLDQFLTLNLDQFLTLKPQCKSSFSPFFVKTTCFRQGAKTPFPKKRTPFSQHSKYTPNPLPWKMPFGQKWGRGGI